MGMDRVHSCSQPIARALITVVSESVMQLSVRIIPTSCMPKIGGLVTMCCAFFGFLLVAGIVFNSNCLLAWIKVKPGAEGEYIRGSSKMCHKFQNLLDSL